MESVERQLRASIKNLRQRSASKRYILDSKYLKEILTKDAIAEVVDGCILQEHLCMKIVGDIFQKGIITFAILSRIEKADAIFKFIERNELNGRLPMIETQVSEIIGNSAPGFCEIL